MKIVEGYIRKKRIEFIRRVRHSKRRAKEIYELSVKEQQSHICPFTEDNCFPECNFYREGGVIFDDIDGVYWCVPVWCKLKY